MHARAHERTRVTMRCGSKGWSWRRGSRCMPRDRSIDPARGPGALPTLPAASLPPPPAAGGWTDMDAWTPGRRLHACATSHRLRPTPTATRRRRYGRWRRRCVEEWPGQGRLVFAAAFGTGRRRDLGVHACTHEHDRMTLAGWGLRLLDGAVCNWCLLVWPCVASGLVGLSLS